MVGHGRLCTFRACVVAAGAVAAVLVSAIAHADEPVAPEADTNPSSAPAPSARANLVLVGAAVAVGWYGAAYGTSYLWADSDGAASLRVPVAGPYMALAKAGCSINEADCDTFTVVLRTILTGISAVGQTGGVLAMLEGAFVPTGVSQPAMSAAARDRSAHVSLAPGPSGANGLGFGVFGQF